MVWLSAWDKADHFTWWGVAFHAACLGAGAGFRADLAVQAWVIAGVWGMSAMGCAMLVTTRDEMGTAAYAVGNFAVHYLPFISALARVDATDCAGPGALLLWVAYLTFVHDPAEVYGCDLVSRRVVAGTGSAVVVIASLK